MNINLNSIIKYIIFSTLMFALSACNSVNNSASSDRYYASNMANNSVRGIELSNTYVPFNLENGETSYSINAKVIPNTAVDSELMYKSDNESILQVDEKGNVLVKNEGSASIRIISKSNPIVYADVVFNIYNGSSLPSNGNDGTIRNIVLESSPYIMADLNDKSSRRIIGKISNDSSKAVKHISSNPSSIMVDKDSGAITLLQSGDAYIISYAEANPSVYAVTYVLAYDGNSVDTSNLKKIDLNKDPFSLIAKYNIKDYSISGENSIVPEKKSELRVNINLALPTVEILMYTNIEGKEVSLIRKEDVSNYGSIPDIFSAIGAEITGDYTLRFTIKGSDYPQFVNAGLIGEDETLIMNLMKYEDMSALSGLGDDIVFNPDDSGSGDTEEPVEPGEPVEPVEPETPYIPVESVRIYPGSFSPQIPSETVQLSAILTPTYADNKTIVWSSSDESIATVSEDGLVTVLKNEPVKITANSADNKSASMDIVPADKVTDFILVEDVKDLVIGEEESFQIELLIYPYILQSNLVSNVQYSVNSDVITVTDTGKVSLSGNNKTGIAIVDVRIGDIVRNCLVRVSEPQDENIRVESISLESESGSYSPQQGTFRITPVFQPENATNKRLEYKSSNENVATVTSTGVVTIKALGTSDITVTSLDNRNASVVYHLTVETMPTKIVFETTEYGVGLNQKTTIQPVFEGSATNKKLKFTSSDPSVATVNESTGEVTGLKIGTTTITAVHANNSALKSSYTLSVFTPLNMASIQSLQGTYDIVNFNQANGYLNVGTNQYGGVERMIGELTITVSGNTVKMVSKIQMDSSRMNTFGGVMGQGISEAREGQFQLTKFVDLQYNSNGFGSTGTTDKAIVSTDNGLLKTVQSFKVSVATVNVNTWYRKKSNNVKTLTGDNFYWTKNGADGLGSANAVQYFPSVKPPVTEPYYTYGLIK